MCTTAMSQKWVIIQPAWVPLPPSSTHIPQTLFFVTEELWRSPAGLLRWMNRTMAVGIASILVWECLHSAAFFLWIQWDHCLGNTTCQVRFTEEHTYLLAAASFSSKSPFFFVVLKQATCKGSLWETVHCSDALFWEQGMCNMDTETTSIQWTPPNSWFWGFPDSVAQPLQVCGQCWAQWHGCDRACGTPGRSWQRAACSLKWNNQTNEQKKLPELNKNHLQMIQGVSAELSFQSFPKCTLLLL